MIERMHLRRIRQGDPQGKKSSSSPITSSPSRNTQQNSNATSNGHGSPEATTEGRWQPLRSARKAATAAIQKRGTADNAEPSSNNKNTVTHNNNNNTATPTPARAPSSQTIAAYSDNFTFAPIPNFIPISSCDNLLVEPPDFKTPSDLKMSNNFSKLITNAKKVDQVRLQAKRASQPKPDPNITLDDIIKENNQKQQHEQNNSNSNNNNNNHNNSNNNNHKQLTIEEAQKRLIEQLKLSLNYLSEENKELGIQRSSLEGELHQNKYLAREKQKEVDERNLKLAVLEHHFRILNNVDMKEEGQAAMGVTIHAGAGDATEGHNGNDVSNNAVKQDDEGTAREGNATTATANVMPTANSSIIQIDKGYYMQLEATVKREIFKREKVEEVNTDLAMKYAILERDSQKELLNISQQMKESQEELKGQVSRQERTMQSLEQSLSKSRELLFKKGKKGHKRRATVSALPTAEEVKQRHQLQNQDQDEHSISEATMSSARTDNEEDNVLEKQVVKDAINNAVKEGLEEQAAEHQSLMDLLSKQLERKDTHISTLETKMFSMLKSKNEGGALASPKKTRVIPQDVMIRNMSVTNELLDTSMRKLENMIAHFDRVGNENNTHIVDEMAPIRRVATAISLVHEEMKVSMKLLEQKIQNGAEIAQQQQSKSTAGEKRESGDSAQSSGDDAEEETAKEQPNVEELIANITNALKETELCVRDEIRELNDRLGTIQGDLEAKNDTIESLELACTEHVESYQALQNEYEVLDANGI